VYVLLVQPGIVRQPRLIATCAGALVGTLVLVYLELPIRAGILRAPLVYGTPNTWEGFLYIFLAQQFQGSVGSPLEDLGPKWAALAKLAAEQLGVLALFLPAGFIVTLGRFPRFAVLSGLAALVTCLFSASYVNADISRYYLGPLLIAWTWLAILGAVVVDVVLELAGRLASRGVPGSRWPALALSAVIGVLLVLPTIQVVPTRSRQLDESGDVGAAVWVDAALERIAHNAVVVSWWSYSTPLWYATLVEGRRPDIFVVDDRTMLDLELGEATDVIARYYGRRPVYVIRANEHDLDLVKAQFTLAAGTGPAANVYEVTGIVKRGT
jgi:hypothetical protein